MNAINLFGPLEMTQALLPHLKKAGAARVIHVSSGYGQVGGLSANAPSYCLPSESRVLPGYALSR